jgi:hypothetical protein
VSGNHDEMCDLERLEGVRREMKAKSWRIVVHGADHGMNVKPKKGTKGVGELIGEVMAKWIEESNHERTEGNIWWDEAKKGAIWSGWEAEASGDASRVDVKADKRKSSKPEDSDRRKPKRIRQKN